MTGQELYFLISPNNNMTYHKGKRQWPILVAISTKMAYIGSYLYQGKSLGGYL